MAILLKTSEHDSASFLVDASEKPGKTRPLTPRVQVFSYRSRSVLVAVFEKSIDVSELKNDNILQSIQWRFENVFTIRLCAICP